MAQVSARQTDGKGMEVFSCIFFNSMVCEVVLAQCQMPLPSLPSFFAFFPVLRCLFSLVFFLLPLPPPPPPLLLLLPPAYYLPGQSLGYLLSIAFLHRGNIAQGPSLVA